MNEFGCSSSSTIIKKCSHGSMDRFIPISTTNESIGLILFNNEQVFSLQDSVGLYDGKEKTLNQTSGTIYLTSHRLIYVDSLDPHFNSCCLDLSLIRQTEYYAGFLKSSPKVTLFLSQSNDKNKDDPKIAGQGSGNHSTSPAATSQRDWRYGDKDKGQSTFDDGNQLVQNVNKFNSNWVCGTCGYSNDASSSIKCQLCGVAKSTSSSSSNIPISTSNSTLKSRSSSNLNDPIARLKANHPSTSQPDLSLHPSDLHGNGLSKSLSSESTIPFQQGSSSTINTSKEGINCPICTFSNHPSMVKCEICDSPLTDSKPEDSPVSSSLITSRDRTVSLLKESELRTSSSQSSLNLPSPSRVSNQQPSTDSVKLSFRKGGDKAFYGTIKKALIAKDWLRDSNGKLIDQNSDSDRGASSTSTSNVTSRSRPSSSSYNNNNNNSNRNSASIDIDGRTSIDPSKKSVGIEAILSTNQLSTKTQSKEMSTAFSDLETLMKKAKEMVDLAEELNGKLLKSKQKSREGGAGGLNSKEEEEAENLINNSLVRLGLKNPAFTKDMAESLEEYHFGLARELASLLLSSNASNSVSSNTRKQIGGGGLMGIGKVLEKERGTKELESLVELDRSNRGNDASETDSDVDRIGRGIIGLDEVWCIWNRARGIALIPPQALRSASTYLPKITEPIIKLKTFKSGLTVLHTPRFNETNFSQRLERRLRRRENEVVEDQREGFDGQIDTYSLVSSTSVDFGNGLSSLDISNLEGIPLNLTNEMIESCEMKFGNVLRDDGGKQGTKWFSNRFQELSLES